VSTTTGPTPARPNPIGFTTIVQWEGETDYYFGSHTGGSGLFANPYAVRIVFNGGPLIAGDRIYLRDSSGQEIAKVDETVAADVTRDQFAIGFSANPASPANPYYYLIVSPKTQHAGTNSHDHGQKLTYTIVDENSAGHADTTLVMTYVADGRCRANSIQVSDTMPKKGQSLTVNWDAGPCKAAVVTKSAGTGGTIAGGLGTNNTIGGPYLFQNRSSQPDASFTGTVTQFQILSDTTYELYAIDGLWRLKKERVQAKVQVPASNTTVPTGCPNNAPWQNFDMHVECSLGCYSYPGYQACSQAAATAELQGMFGGCSVKTGVSCP
jgi:hypothetical protein